MSFKSYTAVPRIARVWKRMQEIQSQLRTQLDADFDALYVPQILLVQETSWLYFLIGSYLHDTNKSIKSTLIADACSVVDVLGPDVRTHLIERFVALELKEYRRIFRTNDEAGQLDNITRRFAWFRRLLQNYEIEHGRIFPAEWKVSWHLLAKFAEITRRVVNCNNYRVNVFNDF